MTYFMIVGYEIMSRKQFQKFTHVFSSSVVSNTSRRNLRNSDCKETVNSWTIARRVFNVCWSNRSTAEWFHTLVMVTHNYQKFHTRFPGFSKVLSSVFQVDHADLCLQCIPQICLSEDVKVTYCRVQFRKNAVRV